MDKKAKMRIVIYLALGGAALATIFWSIIFIREKETCNGGGHANDSCLYKFEKLPGFLQSIGEYLEFHLAR